MAAQDPNIADKDETVHDDLTGLDYKVIAGQPIPAHILALKERQESAKAQRAPDKDKAQKAPDTDK
jgi:hypothetical protein